MADAFKNILSTVLLQFFIWIMQTIPVNSVFLRKISNTVIKM